MRPWFFLLAVLAFALAAPTARAQGRCRCNNGCHNYPGQCVNGSGNCDQGYAPFCATRPASECRTGWVSCSGECTCVRIPGWDGGAVSDGAMVDTMIPLDAARADVLVGMDGGTVIDGSQADGAPTMDAAVGMDTPRVDVTLGNDVSSGTDVPLGTDVARDDGKVATDSPGLSREDVVASEGGARLDVPVSDAVIVEDASVDGPCECDGGVCYHGVCVRERCAYQPELGFVCAYEGRRCVLLAGEAWCVPGCLGVTCPKGEVCEAETGNCLRDRCAELRCPLGSRCMMNRCVAADGGLAGEGGVTDGGGIPTGVEDGGCGCRAHPTTPRTWMFVAVIACVAMARRRRAV